MKQLDCFDRVRSRIGQTALESVLFPHELDAWYQLTEADRDHRLQRICTLPLCDGDFTVVAGLYFRLKWLDAFKACVPPKGARILEVGSGSSATIPNALSVCDAGATYITANMNKALTAGLRQNTAALPIAIEVIEDDANNITRYLQPNAVDAVVFEHSVNDILQAMLCERRGMDTTNDDWFALLPEMIAIIGQEYVSQTLELSVGAAFLSLIRNCLSVLKPGGCLIMSHYMFQYDLDLGYNVDLWQNMLQVVRPWLKTLPGGKEVTVDGFDPQWWLFYQK